MNRAPSRPSQVLLKRPLGVDLEEISEGEARGVRVSGVEKGSNAERAGIAEGDRVSVPGRTPLAPWREDASSVLAAVSGQVFDRFRAEREQVKWFHLRMLTYTR